MDATKEIAALMVFESCVPGASARHVFRFPFPSVFGTLRLGLLMLLLCMVFVLCAV